MADDRVKTASRVVDVTSACQECAGALNGMKSGLEEFTEEDYGISYLHVHPCGYQQMN